jgi:Polyketide cyclase / dehydrase and lipid transport
MDPVAVSVTVAKPREEVFDHLDLLANHAPFMDHMFKKWTFSGPPRGVGAKGQATVSAPGSSEVAEFEVVESERPARIVEQGVSAKGNRRTSGTYSLEQLPDGGTKINFELDWTAVPRSERILPPLSRAFMRRALGKAMRRLGKELEKG